MKLLTALTLTAVTAILVAAPAQAGKGCADPGMGGQLGYKVVCGVRDSAGIRFIPARITENPAAARFYSERSAGQNDPGLGAVYGHKVVSGFMTEHASGQYDPTSPVQPVVVEVVRSTRFDWKDAGIGAAGTLALLLLAGGMGLALHRSRARLASF